MMATVKGERREEAGRVEGWLEVGGLRAIESLDWLGIREQWLEG